jgi:uncharacterized membrane protein
LAPRLLVYLMSFMTLGIFWIGQQTQFNQLSQSDRHLTWIHIAFLALVSIMPFSTSFLAEFIGFRLALLLYWANILLLGLILDVSWRYADHSGLVQDSSHEVRCAIERRILIAQSLYAFGAFLCIFNTYWGIGSRAVELRDCSALPAVFAPLTSVNVSPSPISKRDQCETRMHIVSARR